MKKRRLNWLKSIFLGDLPIYEANGGMPVDPIVIRYKDFFFEIDFDVATGLPTGDFGWTRDSPITHVPIREFYIATREEPINDN